MTSIGLYKSIPSEYSAQGTSYGSNSKIYLDIVNELKRAQDDVEEIHLALYLFNNRYLYNELLEIAKKGPRTTVTSIPLTGYDHRKINEAEYVYEKTVSDGVIDLRVFPHMYMWYGAEYAEGGASYSFHVKAGLVKYRNGTSKVFLTSGNLAPGDPTHSELALFLETPQNSSSIQIFDTFFSEVEKRTKSFVEYSKATHGLSPELRQVFDFAFIGGINKINLDPARTSSAFFTAPFMTIGGKGSNHYARERLTETIPLAKQRLFLCAQHSHDIAPFDSYPGQTIIRAITKIKDENPATDVKVLKQVSSKGLADKRRAAFVEAHLFHAGVPQKANRLVHDKFVLVDNTSIVTTGNFTATQFGWGEREMEQTLSTNDLGTVKHVLESAENFFAIPGARVWARMTRPKKGSPKVKIFKNDEFSEVNSFMIIEDPILANSIGKYFDELWNHTMSRDIEIPW